MKRSTKIITAVALSIGLIGGAAAIGKNRHNPEQRADRMVQRITTELALDATQSQACLLYTSPSPRDATLSRMPSSA